ncbi:MAG: rhomboid family intramembrane serine protease [Bacteroidota bacterium]|nr:rhomboid family intramembrane serine protease [Bacteroidota bacterium]
MANQIIEDLKAKIRNGNPVTRLIIINIAVFLFLGILRILVFLSAETMAETERLVHSVLALPLNLQPFLNKPWTLITHMFTHIFFSHIFWNMITLYWFGTILSEYTSTRKIIPLYLMGGLTGAIIAILMISFVPMFEHPFATGVGASAGVTAIIVAAATLVPNYKMNLLFLGPVKLLYIALFSIFISVLNVASYSNMGGNLAHLGGALFGYIFIVQYKKGIDLSSGINRFFDWIKGIFKKGPKAKMNVAYKRKVSDEEYNINKKAEQQHIDAILDKISKSGYESLSKSEKEILFKASNKK